MPYVYSMLGQDMSYTIYKKTHDLPVPEHQILIKGGSGVIDKNLITPRGVRTKISDKDYDYLQRDKIFQIHKENGFIHVDENKEKVNTISKDLESHDNSSQLTPQDFHNQTDPRFQEAGIKAAKPQEKKVK